MNIRILFLIAFLVVSVNISYSQNPSAMLSVIGDTAFCESGEGYLKIEFFDGKPEYGYLIKIYPNGDPVNWISKVYQADPIDDNELINGYFIDTLKVWGSYTYELIEFYDANLVQSDWVEGRGYKNVSGKVEFRLDSMPEPKLNIVDNSICGDIVEMASSAIPELSTSSVYWTSTGVGSFNDTAIVNAVFTSDLKTQSQQIIFTFYEVNGACIESAIDTVNLLGKPSGELNGYKDICLVDSVSITINFEGNGPWNFSIVDAKNDTLLKDVAEFGHLSNLIVNEVVGNNTLRFGYIVDNNGCFGYVDTIFTGTAKTVNIQPKVSLGDNKTICGVTDIIVADFDKGVDSWQISSGSANIIETVNNSALIQSYVEGNVGVVCTVNNDGCNNSDTVYIEFAKNSIVNPLSNDTTICEGGTAHINIDVKNNPPWDVKYSDGLSDFSQTFTSSPVVINLDVVENQTYSIKSIVNSKGCVTIFDSLDFQISVESNVSAYAGEDQSLDRVYQTILNGSPSDLNGCWSFVSGNGNIVSPFSSQTIIDSLKVGVNVLSFTVLPMACPSSSDNVTITVNKYKYYNGFSPDGLGKNERFTIEGADSDEQNKLMVFDQFGKLVYQKEGYFNQWDGTDMSDKPLDDGIYYFIFTSENEEAIKDYVVIRRAKTNNQ
ncbi:MAG: gliding motility-associated C-terminal domain-containing protein [Marinilabiliaceae bacterium]|nr:gliding motility-associated C-terminal domain-containing protein [Marinilabiliaceae bacterium]